MKKPKIFIACDTTNLAKVKQIIKQSKTNKIKIGYKFGLEFINSKKGRQFISTLKNLSQNDRILDSMKSNFKNIAIPDTLSIISNFILEKKYAL